MKAMWRYVPLVTPRKHIYIRHALESVMGKMSIRIPEGFHYAISEMADRLDLSISHMAGLLVAAGLQVVDPGFFSQKARELIMADTMEAYGSFIRFMAELAPKERELAEADLQRFIRSLQGMFGKTFWGTEGSDG